MILRDALLYGQAAVSSSSAGQVLFCEQILRKAGGAGGDLAAGGGGNVGVEIGGRVDMAGYEDTPRPDFSLARRIISRR